MICASCSLSLSSVLPALWFLCAALQLGPRRGPRLAPSTPQALVQVQVQVLVQVLVQGLVQAVLQAPVALASLLLPAPCPRLR